MFSGFPRGNSNDTKLYDILGVTKEIDNNGLKKAYRKLAMKWHPDKNPGNQQAEQKFKEISSAYDILSDADKRKTYDQFGLDAVKGMSQGGGGGHNPFDMFGNIFGGTSPFGGGRPMRSKSEFFFPVYATRHIGKNEEITINYGKRFSKNQLIEPMKSS